MRVRRGSEIIANRPGQQITFNSKHEACRELAVTMKRLHRIIDKNLPITYQDLEWWLDEMYVMEKT